jgi:8-oxo-dGTP diphosphatase
VDQRWYRLVNGGSGRLFCLLRIMRRMLDSDLTVVLVPHCASVSRDGWTGDHHDRPLSDAGREQARALAQRIGPDIDAIYSSPALRCRETVQPLSAAAGLPVGELSELYEAVGFREPAAWVDGVYAPMGEAVAGAWIAGRALGGLARLSRRYPGGRVVACSHGDVIPVLLSLLAGAYGTPVPAVVGRGGWYTLEFAREGLAVTANSMDVA